LRFFLAAAFAIVPMLSFANSKSILLGHNLTPTTATTKKGVVNAGSYALTYGITDDTMIGTNTWMVWDYNSYNAVMRTKWNLADRFWDEISLQGVYLKSAAIGKDYYRMEAGMAWLTGKKIINSSYTLYTSFNYMNFWDETLPFSLRREPGTDDSYQYSISTLHELSMSDRFGFLLELGILGINYVRPEFQSGLSFHYTTETFLAQLGFSVSATPYNTDRLYQPESFSQQRESPYDVSAHPEIQFQYFF
jgi:hypothetical protein